MVLQDSMLYSSLKASHMFAIAILSNCTFVLLCVWRALILLMLRYKSQTSKCGEWVLKSRFIEHSWK